ncbi:hypothetical protein EUZ85_26750 [Hahella sp. KA22]|uniref:hypothetical protein n=1 Tax=Hahella sp. KA22 TaxID=1628392 RepID=UPI000FDEA908|nr:hypothetical protein [Hahella sp. KA22]AZZ94123.1 hypothetical protein ENC22_24165 [Hahella sp. KA22]QAY57497.1 hypothetical protein EUZ85_26750 [Hahella sp. KA22]
MSMSGFLSQLFREIIIPLAIVAALICSVIALRWGLEHSIQTFCDDLPQGALMETVIQEAEAEGFTVMRDGAASDRVSILNHQAPFFRLACQCEFSGGRLQTKRLLQAD